MSLFDPESALASASAEAIALHVVTTATAKTLSGVPEGARKQAEANGFIGASGQSLIMMSKGEPIALYGVGDGSDRLALGDAPLTLPEGVYEIASHPESYSADDLVLGWLLGSYQFINYKKPSRAPARLKAESTQALMEARAVCLCRDLVNTPAADMGPSQIEAVIRDMAERFDASVSSVVGADLLAANYPLIHAVGRAASEAPRLIEMTWGSGDDPHLVIIGKGVSFDTGGLNIKTGDFMRLMKKDMGGAAHAIALAHWIMDAAPPLQITLIIPTVENAVAGNAFRPGDIIKSRKGLTVEIENTDAEGRLILADALARAEEIGGDFTVDFATLTGAARVALGPQLAPFYSDDSAFVSALESAAQDTQDAVWRMPLWQGYVPDIKSPIADLKNLGNGPMAGSVTAALFLQQFAPKENWAHFDIFAWNPAKRPGRPVGGDAHGLRSFYRAIQTRLGASV